MNRYLAGSHASCRLGKRPVPESVAIYLSILAFRDLGNVRQEPLRHIGSPLDRCLLSIGQSLLALLRYGGVLRSRTLPVLPLICVCSIPCAYLCDDLLLFRLVNLVLLNKLLPDLRHLVVLVARLVSELNLSVALVNDRHDCGLLLAAISSVRARWLSAGTLKAGHASSRGDALPLGGPLIDWQL